MRRGDSTPDPLRPSLQGELTLRFAFPDDTLALARLAALDSGEPLEGVVLLAEIRGELRAALSLRDGRAIADPFHLSEWVLALLRARAAQLRVDPAGREARTGRRSTRAKLRLAGR